MTSKNRDAIATHIVAWSTVVLALITLWYAYLTNQMVDLSSQMVTQSSNQTDIITKSYLRSLEAQLTGFYEFPGRDEFFVVKNAGAISVENLVANTHLYFINRAGKIYTIQGLQNLLTTNQKLLTLLQKANLIQYPKDVGYLLSGPRELYAGKLEIKERSFSRLTHLSTKMPSSSVKPWGFKVVARWCLTFANPIDAEPHTTKMFFLIEPHNNRSNLGNVLGGYKVISALNQFEELTEELIFGFENSGKK